MFCQECGHKLEKEDKFCNNCGTKITNSKMEVIKNKINFKYLIIGLLSVIIILLTIFIVFNNCDNKNNVESLLPHTRTIMIYLEGSNLESENRIASSDLDSIDPNVMDLENTKLYIYTGGTKLWHNFISNNENAIYEFTENGFNKVKTYPKSNMGDPTNLSTFINYVYDTSKTDYYDLVLYDHGGGIDGAIYDDFTSDNLKVNEFTTALKNTKFNSNNKLETVLFRTCLNGTIEVANAFKDYASYLIASEEVTLGSEYTPVLKYINNIKSTDSAIDYGKHFIDSYKEQIESLASLGENKIQTYSIIDLSKLNKLNEEFDDYIKTVNLSNNFPNIVRIRSGLFQYAGTTFGQYDYNTVDMMSLINELKPYGGNQTKLINAFNDTVIYNWTNGGDSHGLSIFFPYTGKSEIRNQFLKVYKTFDYSPSYSDFITDFNTTRLTNKVTSFSKSNLIENKSDIKTSGEFTLELTDEQLNDYAESLYIIFRKGSDGKYTIVYSSNNTEVSGNKLITHTENNMIKIDDVESGGFYLPLVERTSGGKTTRSFSGLLENFDEGLVMKNATWYIDYDKDGNPYIVDAIINSKSEEGASGVIANLDDYTIYGVISSHYNIFDKNGNYSPNWDNEGIIQGYEIEKENFKMTKASTFGSDDFYCVFKIYDIYGNSYYSKVLKMN